LNQIEIIPNTPFSESDNENSDKTVIFGVACKDNQGNQYEVDMQRAFQVNTKKITYYGAKLQLKKVSHGSTKSMLFGKYA